MKMTNLPKHCACTITQNVTKNVNAAFAFAIKHQKLSNISTILQGTVEHVGLSVLDATVFFSSFKYSLSFP